MLMVALLLTPANLSQNSAMLDKASQASCYFCEISKFRDVLNTLRNFEKSVFAHISAKFKYFAKQFILTESPDHVL